MNGFIELTTTFGMSKTPVAVSVRMSAVTTFFPFGAGTRLNFGERADAGTIVVLEDYATVCAITREAYGDFDDDDTRGVETEPAA